MKSLFLKASLGCFALLSAFEAHAKAPSLRVPLNVVGARPAALGGAFTAVADDQNALFYNPAGLARLDSTFAAFADFSLSASVGAGGLSALRNDISKIADAAKDLGGGADTSSQIDSFSKIGEIVSSRTVAMGFKNQSYWVSPHWGIATTLGMDSGLGVHSKILPELADLALLADVDARFGYAHSFVDKKFHVGLAPYYKLRAQGGQANFSLAEAIEFEETVKSIVGVGQGIGVDLGLMVTPVEAMSPTFGLAILNVGDTKLYSAGKSLFSNVSLFNEAKEAGTPDLIKQAVNVGFSLTPIDGPGFIRVSGELKEINRPSAGDLKPAIGLEGGFRSRFVRAVADLGWGNGNWSAGFELRLLAKVRFSTYVEPNLFFDRKENQRVWVLSLGL
jgi:hypothetical protein